MGILRVGKKTAFRHHAAVEVVVARIVSFLRGVDRGVAAVVFDDVEKNEYSIYFLWKDSVFFAMKYTPGEEFCSFAGLSGTAEKLPEERWWCRAYFEKFPFEDREIPKAWHSLLCTEGGARYAELCGAVEALIKPAERVNISIGDES